MALQHGLPSSGWASLPVASFAVAYAGMLAWYGYRAYAQAIPVTSASFLWFQVAIDAAIPSLRFRLNEGRRQNGLGQHGRSLQKITVVQLSFLDHFTSPTQAAHDRQSNHQDNDHAEQHCNNYLHISSRPIS